MLCFNVKEISLLSLSWMCANGCLLKWIKESNWKNAKKMAIRWWVGNGFIYWDNYRHGSSFLFLWPKAYYRYCWKPIL